MRNVHAPCCSRSEVVGLLVVALLAIASHANAQVNILHTFMGGPDDGAFIQDGFENEINISPLVVSGTNLYGVTSAGGPNGYIWRRDNF